MIRRKHILRLIGKEAASHSQHFLTKSRIAIEAANAAKQKSKQSEQKSSCTRSKSTTTFGSCSCLPLSIQKINAQIRQNERNMKKVSNNTTNNNDPPLLWTLVEKFQWDHPYFDSISPENVEQFCHYQHPHTKMTPLHLICSIGSAPKSIIHTIIQGWPRALLQQDKTGMTPLHYACQRCQKTSTHKIAILLQYPIQNLSILSYTRYHSPLHTACSCNAMFSIIELLVDIHPSLLLVKDRYGYIPANLLWSSFRQNVQGMMILQDCSRKGGMMIRWSEDSVIGRFWKKMNFVLMKTYQISHSDSFHQSVFPQDYNINRNEMDKKDSVGETYPLLLHAILYLRPCPITFLSAVLSKLSHLCRNFDSEKTQNYPLHILCKTPLVGSKKNLCSIWKQTLEAYPEAAALTNREDGNDNGRYPLMMALQYNATTWEYGIQHLFLAAPNVIMERDSKTCLYPFMLAAASPIEMSKGLSLSELEVLNSCYNLLRVQPDVLENCFFK